MAQRFAKLSSEWSFSGVWLSFSKVFPGLVTPRLCRAWMKTHFSSMLFQKWPWLFSVVIKDSLEIPKIDASYAFVKRKLIGVYLASDSGVRHCRGCVANAVVGHCSSLCDVLRESGSSGDLFQKEMAAGTGWPPCFRACKQKSPSLDSDQQRFLNLGGLYFSQKLSTSWFSLFKTHLVV